MLCFSKLSILSCTLQLNQSYGSDDLDVYPNYDSPSRVKETLSPSRTWAQRVMVQPPTLNPSLLESQQPQHAQQLRAVLGGKSAHPVVAPMSGSPRHLYPTSYKDAVSRNIKGTYVLIPDGPPVSFEATLPLLAPSQPIPSHLAFTNPPPLYSNITSTILRGKLRLHDKHSFGHLQPHLEFTSNITFQQICCILFKSDTLEPERLEPILASDSSYQQLYHAMTSRRPLASTFVPTSGDIVNLAIACDFYIPLIISCLRGEYTGDYRDPFAIVSILREHNCPEHILNDILRVFTVGAPAQFKFNSSSHNLTPFITYGNHSSANKHIDIAWETITKELDRSYAFALPDWTIPFIPHLHLSPLGILIKEGKKPRIIIDHSFEPTLDTICVNRMHHITNEIAIEYGSSMMRHLIRIANLRISYPTAPLYLFDTDVTGAFRHVKYNPFIASAFSYSANGRVLIPTAQDFGSTTSPSNYEPLALGHAWLSQAYSSPDHSHLLSKHKSYLDMIHFDHPESHTIASLMPDPLNQGVHVLEMISNTLHIPHVDDNLMADILDRIKQAIVASAESCFTIFGDRCDHIRPCPLSLEKLKQGSCSPIRTQLGISINTNLLTVGLPVDKHLKIQHQMEAFHLRRKCCSILEGATLLGLLEHIGTYLPWFRHVYGNIRASFNDALRKSNINIERSDAYINCLNAITHLEGSDLVHHLKHLARMKAKAIYKAGGNKDAIRITFDFRQDLNLILALSSDIHLWTTPIPHIIPRTPDYTAFCDSCSYGAGGYSPELGFMWHIFWPKKVTAKCIDVALPSMDESNTHINLLEYASILITYAIAQCTLRDHPSLRHHSYPTLRIHTDNTTAQCWTYKAASSADKGAKDLARINCSLQLGACLGLHAVHIKGDDNFIADDISRIANDSPFAPQLQTIVHRHNVLQSCSLYPVPPNLFSVLSGLLSSTTDRPIVTWKKVDRQIIPVCDFIKNGRGLLD